MWRQMEKSRFGKVRELKYHMVRRPWLCLHLGLILTEVLV